MLWHKGQLECYRVSIEVSWDNVDDPMYTSYYAFVSLDSFDDTETSLVKSGIRDTILILNEFNGEMIVVKIPIGLNCNYNEVHTFYADPVEVPRKNLALVL